MYPSKGTGAYAQQPYSGQQAQVKTHGVGDVGAQRAMASRQSLVPSSQDADVGGYRAHYEQGTQYSGPYASVYGSTTLSGAHQVGGKGTTTSGIHNDEYVPASSHAYSQKTDPYTQKPDPYSQKADTYSQKSDPYSLVKGSDYDSVDRRHYADQSSYLGIELQNDTARRYADPISIRQRQVDTHDRMDPATLIREQQMRRAAQPLHSGSDPRQSEYLAARAAPVNSYGGRLETVDPRSLPILGSTPYDIQHASSASHLGGALRRSIDDLYATQGASGVTAPYGVGLPPGRDYISGKGLLSDSDYLAHPMSLLHDRKDDRAAYRRELERDEEHRRELLRAKEKDREREEREREERELKRERDRRDRDREREREKEREREREREKERERERERSRRRSLDRRDRDRERDRSLQRSTKDLPRRLTPRRPSPRRPSPRRASSPPRHEAAHRHRSSFKEKEREYTCKVFPFCLVDAERDYLSLSKRYPKLYVSPDCSKVVLHWPKQTLQMSLHTPVSFEHEYVELDGQGGKMALVPSDKNSQLKHQNTVWNAKVLLMSGIDSDALNNMCSYKSSEDKIVHFYNMMRFAMIKQDSSFMAIGGPWNAEIDGGDPSVEDTSLIKTAQRYLKDITALELQFCKHWNRFLEIHYDRIGEDGLFSHKEVTVLYVPDLSDSLPSLDTWRTQWLEHRKNLVERERQKVLKDKKSSEEKKLDQEKNAKDTKTDSNVKTKNEGKLLDKTKVTPKKSDKGNTDTDSTPRNSTEENIIDEKGKGPLLEETKVENADGKEITAEETKPKTTVKKKVIKRVIKGKTAAKQEMKEAKKESDVKEEVTPELSPKTSAEKKVTEKKVADTQPPKVKTENQEENSTQKESGEAPTAQEIVTKTKGKKKIIRRVIKKKVPIKKAAGSEDMKDTEVKEEKELKAEVEKTEVKEKKELKVEAKDSVVLDPEKSNSTGKNENDENDIKKENKISEQNVKSDKADKELEKTDGSNKKEKTKDEKEKKNKDYNRQKDIKEKEKLDEPPAYPGLFLQTKRSKGSKIRSMSLSLGGLLDYNDKDVDEATFELSIFAEAFNEMLQYQMACRLLSFLQKLRKRRVTKKNQRKRQRDEKAKEENKSSSPKQRKLSEGDRNKVQSSKSKKQVTEDQSRDVQMGEAEDDEHKNEDESKNGNKIVEDKGENKSDYDNHNNNTEDEDEEPEENIDEDEEPEENVEDEEMKDVVHDDGTEKGDNVAKKDNASAVSEKCQSDAENLGKAVNEDAKLEAEKTDKEKPVKSESAIDFVYDKELLQAFRYFDYNRVGYIKVDDLRCLLHNMGMFLSYRDVKELVQSALLESNTAMDNRIFYKKLVKLTEL